MMVGKKVTGVIRSAVLIDETGKVFKHRARVAKTVAHPAHVLETLNSLSCPPVPPPGRPARPPCPYSRIGPACAKLRRIGRLTGDTYEIRDFLRASTAA